MSDFDKLIGLLKKTGTRYGLINDHGIIIVSVFSTEWSFQNSELIAVVNTD